MKKTVLRQALCAAVLCALMAGMGGGEAAAQESRLTEALFKSLQFRALGPAIMGGRIDDFAVVESNPHTIYAATASGGLWRTTNNGVTWEPLFDGESHSSIGDVALAPSNPDIVWVGTGEPNNRQSSSWGNGVYKSVDGGKTWTNMGLKDSHHIGRIVVHPTNPEIVYVAAVGRLWGPNRERGLFKTTDGGKTWTNTKFIDEDTGFIDVAMDGQDPNVLYAAAYQRRRTPFGFNGGGPGSGLYKTTDGGATWRRLAGGLPEGDAGRIGIDIYRKDPKIVYATYEHAEGGLFRSEDAGATWKKMNEINPRPMYYSQVRIDPQNDQRIYVLGASMYISDNGGKSLSNAGPFWRIHGDFHAMWINPANSNHLLVGSDGGIHFSYDKSRSWDFVNTIPLGQFYEVGFDFRKPYWVYGGLQDNGSWGAPSATLNFTGPSNDEWIRVGGGDGFYTQVDPKDPNTVYTESQNGNIQRLNLLTSEAKFIRPQPPETGAGGVGERYRFDWNSPIVISPHDNRRIYLGGNRLFISNSRGDSWDLVTPDLTKNIDRDKIEIMGVLPKLSRHDGQEGFSQITTIAESPVKEGILWVGTDDGNVQVSRDGGKTWKNVVDRISRIAGGVPRNTYVTRVIGSAAVAGRAYVAFDGHRNDDFRPYVFATEDFGETWRAITGNLPSPANVIREHPRNHNLLFVGTEFGLWVSFNRGGVWRQLKNNLPTVPVDDIAIHPRENDLILATHGRSLWVLDDLSPLEQMTETVAAADSHLLDPRPAVMWRLYAHKAYAGNKTFIANNPPAGAIIHYYLREKAKDKVRITIHDKAGAQVGEVMMVKNEPGLHRVNWDLRHQPPFTLAQTAPGAGFALVGARGPRVLPGEYLVRLVIDGKEVMSKPLLVEEDPRIRISPADAEARLGAFLALNRLQRAGNEALRSLANLRKEVGALQDGLKKQANAPAAVQEAVRSLQQEIEKLQTRLISSQGGVNQQENAGPSDPERAMAVMIRIGQLFNILDSYTEAPGKQQQDLARALTTQLNAAITEVNRLVTETVPRLNKQIEAAGAAPIKAGEAIAPLQN
ncbi:MAG: hypothetical protein SF339_26080 [Blastocatellia bacterium]|nr:hypothetical protein [Blastocatellia bacterium]